MHLAVLGVLVGEVLLHVLGQQVAAVAGGVDQHVVRGLRDRAVEDRLQRLVAGLAFVEAQVVAEDDEALGALGDQVDDVGQVHQVGLVDLDQAQPARRELVQHALISELLPVPRAPVSSTLLAPRPVDELLGVAQQPLLLRLDLHQRVQADGRHVPHRLEHAGGAALAVAEGDRRRPVGRRGRVRQHALRAAPAGARRVR